MTNPIHMACAFALSLTLFVNTPSVLAQETASAEQASPEDQFALMAAWEGRWDVAETSALQIVFEVTARGSTIIERWETASGLHSITVYHLDGEELLATHYCPQGNQPRLESHGAQSNGIHFTFRDVTDLDAGESHTHTLSFTPQSDGSLLRTEVYTGEDGPQEPGSYTLTRHKSAE